MKKETSFEMSKWLDDKGFFACSTTGTYFENCYKGKVEIKLQEYCDYSLSGQEWDDGKDDYNKYLFPSYDIMNDLCITHVTELFGKEVDILDGYTNEEGYLRNIHIIKIIELLQEGKKEEAEQYIMAHSIL